MYKNKLKNKARLKNEDQCPIQTNYGYQPYAQLVNNLESKNKIINELKLLTCNVNKSNIALKNTNSQLNKLITLISNEESPRISTFFRVCLKQKLSPCAIVDKFKDAIEIEIVE